MVSMTTYVAIIATLSHRFGGALDGSARQFTQAYDSNMIPMEFVNTMRKQHQLIMGIGHKVKSVGSVLLFINGTQYGVGSWVCNIYMYM